MLEKLIQGLRKFEEYAVRLPDEYIHSKISTASEWVERKWNISGNKQAATLSVSSWIYPVYVGGIIPLIKYFYQQNNEAFSLAYRAFYEGFKEVLSEEGYVFLKNATKKYMDEALNAWKYSPIITVSFIDSLGFLFNRKNMKNDGTIAEPEIYSHTSLSGVVRPYLLGGAILAIAYGLKKGSPTLVNYGISMLPLAVSLYIRDDQSGGLLEKVRERWKNPNPSRVA
jgi:hypothetical protein